MIFSFFFVLGFVAISFLIDRSQYKSCERNRKQEQFRDDAVITYKIFRKVYAANPQNWELYEHRCFGSVEFLYYIWKNPITGRESRVFFSSVWGYIAMKLMYRTSWFNRHKQRKKQQKIKETEKSLEFVETVRKALAKQAEDAAGSYKKCVEDEIRKTKQRAAHFSKDDDAKQYISIFPGT